MKNISGSSGNALPSGQNYIKLLTARCHKERKMLNWLTASSGGLHEAACMIDYRKTCGKGQRSVWQARQIAAKYMLELLDKEALQNAVAGKWGGRLLAACNGRYKLEVQQFMQKRIHVCNLKLTKYVKNEVHYYHFSASAKQNETIAKERACMNACKELFPIGTSAKLPPWQTSVKTEYASPDEDEDEEEEEDDTNSWASSQDQFNESIVNEQQHVAGDVAQEPASGEFDEPIELAVTTSAPTKRSQDQPLEASSKRAKLVEADAEAATDEAEVAAENDPGCETPLPGAASENDVTGLTDGATEI